MQQRVVLVTGASTGIGLELAHLLTAREAYKVVLTARSSSLSRFAEAGLVASDRLLLRPLDVTCPDQADRLVAEILDHWGRIDVLVNNAAVCFRAVIEHLDDIHEETQFHTNYLGPLHLIRQVLPGMRARRSGRIINMSSVGGMMAMPTMGGYSASKFALEGASEALWYECRPWGIHVTLIEPGFVNSDGFRNARYTERSGHALDHGDDPYHAYYTNLINFITKMMTSSPTTARGVARTILKTMERQNPPLRQGATLDAVVFSILRRILPQRLYHYVLYRALPNIRNWVGK